MSSLSTAIHSLFKDCMSVRAGEKVLILVDQCYHELGYQFYQIADGMAKKTSLVVLPQITNHSCEPPKSIASYMLHHHVIVILTSRSLSHTKARPPLFYGLDLYVFTLFPAAPSIYGNSAITRSIGGEGLP